MLVSPSISFWSRVPLMSLMLEARIKALKDAEADAVERFQQHKAWVRGSAGWPWLVWLRPGEAGALEPEADGGSTSPRSSRGRSRHQGKAGCGHISRILSPYPRFG